MFIAFVRVIENAVQMLCNVGRLSYFKLIFVNELCHKFTHCNFTDLFGFLFVISFSGYFTWGLDLFKYFDNLTTQFYMLDFDGKD